VLSAAAEPHVRTAPGHLYGPHGSTVCGEAVCRPIGRAGPEPHVRTAPDRVCRPQWSTVYGEGAHPPLHLSSRTEPHVRTARDAGRGPHLSTKCGEGTCPPAWLVRRTDPASAGRIHARCAGSVGRREGTRTLVPRLRQQRLGRWGITR
jgi:hypothetical protein